MFQGSSLKPQMCLYKTRLLEDGLCMGKRYIGFKERFFGEVMVKTEILAFFESL